MGIPQHLCMPYGESHDTFHLSVLLDSFIMFIYMHIIYYQCIIFYLTIFFFILSADEDGNISIQEKNELVDRNCECCSRTSCFVCWLRIQNFINIFVSDPLFDLFITLCIVLNTLVMMLEHHDMPQELNDTLTISNYVSCFHLFFACLTCLLNFRSIFNYHDC